jgi:DNA-directed RNA polymerase specialized sigma24 family protein
MVAVAKDSAPPPSGVTVSRVRVALVQFLASRETKKGTDFVKRVVFRKLGEDIEPALLTDLVQATCARALDAESPPTFVWGIPSWVARVTRRTIADYFRGGEDDAENLDRGAAVDDDEGASVFDRHAPGTDWGARRMLIDKWLGTQLGDDPVRHDTYDAMVESAVVGHSLEDLAAARGITVSALTNRIHKLRKELAPKAALKDRETPRMLILFGLFGAVFLGVVAAVVLLLSLLFPPPPPPLVLPLAPSATAAPAPSPSFDNALPTAPAPDGGAENLKPRPPR